MVAAIARELLERGESVQVIKPVQTGAGNDVETDVSIIKRQISYHDLEAHTLFSYALPIGPVAAARSEGKSLELAPVLSRLRGLPEDKDWRIIEGAGSLATPIAEDGKDWADFAKVLGLRRIVLVVDNRVGGIGQSRLVHSFAASKGLEGGVILNESRKQGPEHKTATEKGIRESGIPLLCLLSFNEERFAEGSLSWL